MTQVIRKRNGGCSGRKKVGHEKKSNEPNDHAEKRQTRNQAVEKDDEIIADDELTEDDDDEDTGSVWFYIKRLVSKGYIVDIENKTRSPTKVLNSSEMLKKILKT